MYSRLIVSTHNTHKLREFREILHVEGLMLVSADEAGLPDDPEETGTTFIENARIKAEYAVMTARLPAIADDSGLVVDAIGGAPGVYSKRFGEAGWNDAERNAYLLERLRDVPPENRTARFVAAMALVTPEGVVREVEGVLEGHIALASQGENGFGYDPLFVPDGETRTYAQMTTDEKNAISHRALALAAMRPLLVSLMANSWGER